MNASSGDLMRVLGAGFRPGDGAAPVRTGGLDFAGALAKAQAGELETGLPVTVASGAGLDLSPAQLDRLAGVLDRAHAEGATRVVVMMDGMSLDVDVLARRVLGAADLADGRVLTGVDGVVRLDGDTAEIPVPLPVPGVGGANPSLQRVLELRDGDRAA